jgi:hypothetical protein
MALRAVTYHGNDGPSLALVASDEGNNVHDLIVFDPKDGQSSLVKSVPQRDSGAAKGHNWEPR